jgi:transcriptional regulator with XRE-family HTH domain
MNEEKLYWLTKQEPDPTILARKQLLASFKNHSYRHSFLKEHVRTSIALQTKALRDKYYGTQEALGAALGMAQSWVSQLENPDYGKVTVATLLRLAEAFDVSLEIRFEPFSAFLQRASAISQEYFEVPNFPEEGLQEKTDVETYVSTSISNLQVVGSLSGAMFWPWIVGSMGVEINSVGNEAPIIKDYGLASEPPRREFSVTEYPSATQPQMVQ